MCMLAWVKDSEPSTAYRDHARTRTRAAGIYRGPFTILHPTRYRRPFPNSDCAGVRTSPRSASAGRHSQNDFLLTRSSKCRD
jgi:hypothetical protein